MTRTSLEKFIGKLVEVKATVKGVRKNQVLLYNITIFPITPHMKPFYLETHMWVSRYELTFRNGIRKKMKVRFVGSPYVYERNNGTKDISIKPIGPT